MKKNILITGGAGFVGSHLSVNLLQKGYNVTVLDNLSKQIHGNNPDITSSSFQSIKGKVNFIKGTISSTADIKKAIRNQNVIIHLTAETGTGQSMYQVAHYSRVNICGTASLLDVLASTKHKVEKVLIASSRAIYGEGKYWSEELGYVFPKCRLDEDMKKGDFEVKYSGCTKPLELVATDEESKIHPSSVYGITKQNQEQLIMTVCPKIGIASVGLRYQNIYGAGQSLHNPYVGILSIFSNLIKNNKPINLFEDGQTSRDFVFIDDVVDATILCIESEKANNEVFNVGSGTSTSLREVVNELMDCFDKKVPVYVSGNYRTGDIRHNRADIAKINSLLGFCPAVSFKIGVRNFTDWVNLQPVFDNHFEASLAEIKRRGMFK